MKFHFQLQIQINSLYKKVSGLTFIVSKMNINSVIFFPAQKKVILPHGLMGLWGLKESRTESLLVDSSVFDLHSNKNFRRSILLSLCLEESAVAPLLSSRFESKVIVQHYDLRLINHL